MSYVNSISDKSLYKQVAASAQTVVHHPSTNTLHTVRSSSHGSAVALPMASVHKEIMCTRDVMCYSDSDCKPSCGPCVNNMCQR